MGAETVVIRTVEDYAALWLHMLDDHGASAHSTHGDPVLMHGALVAFNLCDRTYAYAPDAPNFRTSHGANSLRGGTQ